MRSLFIVLTIFLLVLQYQLWFAKDGLVQAWRMHRAVTEQKTQNEVLEKKDTVLVSEIDSLKKGGNAIENRARNDLGMIKKGETYYQIVKP